MVPGFGGFLRIPFLQIFWITEKLISPNLKSTLHHSLISGQSPSSFSDFCWYSNNKTLYISSHRNVKQEYLIYTLHVSPYRSTNRIPSGLRRFSLSTQLREIIEVQGPWTLDLVPRVLSKWTVKINSDLRNTTLFHPECRTSRPLDLLPRVLV